MQLNRCPVACFVLFTSAFSLQWNDGDDILADFVAMAAAHGLVVAPLWSERPRATLRGHFRHWSADITIMEVKLQYL